MNYLWAFLAGGALCLIGQLFIDLTKLSPARILVAYVVAGVVLGGIGVYKPFVDFAGAGATVPLSGFGYLLADGVRKAVTEEGFLGIFIGGFTAAAAGIASVVVFALIVAALFKRGDKMT
jgi:stage V sporulation protein AE